MIPDFWPSRALRIHGISSRVALPSPASSRKAPHRKGERIPTVHIAVHQTLPPGSKLPTYTISYQKEHPISNGTSGRRCKANVVNWAATLYVNVIYVYFSRKGLPDNPGFNVNVCNFLQTFSNIACGTNENTKNMASDNVVMGINVWSKATSASSPPIWGFCHCHLSSHDPRETASVHHDTRTPTR